MGYSLNLDLTQLESIGLKLHNDFRSDDRIGVHASVYASDLESNPTIKTGTKLDILFTPSGYFSDEATASGFLDSDDIKGDLSSSGIYLASNVFYEDVNTSFNLYAAMDKLYENSKYEAHWLLSKGDYNFGSYSTLYGNTQTDYPDSKISFPHSIQASEVVLSGYFIGDNSIRYNLKWDEIINEDYETYTGNIEEPLGGPYRIYVKRLKNLTSQTGEYGVENWDSWKRYPATTMDSGILIDLPYKENNVIQQYMIGINNNCADPEGLPNNHSEGSQELRIFLDTDTIQHILSEFNTKLPIAANIDSIVDTNQEIFVTPDILLRKRAVIGIQDIALIDNTYKKYGEYVSNQYSVDDPVYTFSLRVDEYIPKYSNINQYDIIKYFVEFNSLEWVQISPINRNIEETSNGNIPKIIIFDVVPESIAQKNNNILYLNYDVVIRSFRIKIIIDIRGTNNNELASPEVINYKCIVFNKDQIINI